MVLIDLLNSTKLTSLRLNLAKNKKIRNLNFENLFGAIAAQKNLACLELDLNGTQVALLEIMLLVQELKGM